MTHITVVTYLIVIYSTIHTIEAGTIAQSLLQKYSKGVNKTNVIIEFPSVQSRVLNNPALNLLRGSGKASFMKSLKKKFTSQDQALLLSIINQIRPKLKSPAFYIANVIFVNDLDFSAIKALLAAVPGDFLIREPNQQSQS